VPGGYSTQTIVTAPGGYSTATIETIVTVPAGYPSETVVPVPGGYSTETTIVSVPAGYSTGGVIPEPTAEPLPSGYTISTIYSTTMETITSCPAPFTSCDAPSTVYQTAVVPVSTTTCLITEVPTPSTGFTVPTGPGPVIVSTPIQSMQTVTYTTFSEAISTYGSGPSASLSAYMTMATVTSVYSAPAQGEPSGYGTPSGTPGSEGMPDHSSSRLSFTDLIPATPSGYPSTTTSPEQPGTTLLGSAASIKAGAPVYMVAVMIAAWFLL